MKRFVILAAMAAMTVSVMAQAGSVRNTIGLEGVEIEKTKVMQPDTVMPNGEWQKVVQSEMTAKDGFKYVRQMLAKIVPNYQHNVQLEDTTDCKLVVTAALPLMAKTKSGYWYHGSYNLTLKDNRYRVSGEEVKCRTGIDVNVPGVDTSQGLPFHIVSKDTDGAMQRDLRWKAGKLVALIDKMLKKQKADNDF